MTRGFRYPDVRAHIYAAFRRGTTTLSSRHVGVESVDLGPI